MASLISDGEHMIGFVLCSSSWNCTQFATNKLYNTAVQDEAARKANQVLLVRPFHSLTSSARLWACLVVWTPTPKYCIPDASMYTHSKPEHSTVPPTDDKAGVFGCNGRLNLRLVCQRVFFIAYSWLCVNAIKDWSCYSIGSRHPRYGLHLEYHVISHSYNHFARIWHWLFNDKVSQISRTANRKVLRYGVAQGKRGVCTIVGNYYVT